MKNKMIDILNKNKVDYAIKKHDLDYAICFDNIPVMFIDKPVNIKEVTPKQSVFFIEPLLLDQIKINKENVEKIEKLLNRGKK